MALCTDATLSLMTRATIRSKLDGVSHPVARLFSNGISPGDTDACTCDAENPSLRVGVLTDSDGFLDDLRCWLASHSHATRQALTLERITDPAGTFATDAAGRYLHVVILHGKAADTFEHWPTLVQTSLGPEVLLVGASGLAAARFRESGVSIAGELYGPWALEQVGAVVVCALQFRLPLRRLGRKLVGRVHLKDAIQLLRQSMLVSALSNNGSKRSTARLLGVTRPAVQSMARLLSVPRAPEETERCRWSP